MKKLLSILSTVTAFCAVCLLLALINPFKENKESFSAGDEENPNSRNDYEFMVARDPAANSIPQAIRSREAAFARRLPELRSTRLSRGASGLNLAWKEIGPDNIGGRTRAFAADYVNEGVLLAGGVDGGIWKSTDDGLSWKIKTLPEQIHSTTCVAQDLRAGKTNIWYVGTGEARGSTTNNTRWGAFYHGDGIFKSTDGGETWNLLPSTVSGTPQTDDAFDFVWNVAVNNENSNIDEVFAATWKGIYRSTNGGLTWTLSKPSDGGTINTTNISTEVVVASDGVVYAHTREAGALKLWRSTDGVNWTSIAPVGFPASSGRVVLASVLTDPAVLYVFVQGPDGNSGGHAFWKYTYNNSGGIWENRSANLPGDLNTQTGYDQIVNVKPGDPNFVIIGGTNLYRSTNGFANSSATTVIGGYDYYPDLNHHPDLHGGMFKPSDPAVYYSANDGGLQRTDNINQPVEVVWTSLNNGYNITQVYSVSISPDAGDKRVIAGAQDNGSLATDSSGYWYMIYGGDGTVVELPPAADDRMYTQYQNGQMQRQTRAGQAFYSITPGYSTRQLFVNPIALDPNNSRIMYYAGGSTSPNMYSGLWRNDNIVNADNTTGWNIVTGSDVGEVTAWTRRVSAIGISTSNARNVVYYGTTDGIIKRVDSAASLSPVVTDITPPGLNGGTAAGGFVRCVAVDPVNSSKALAAFGNYNFKSLWLTTDKGQHWTDVEGNLAGPDGPSVRWATMIYYGSALHVYIGTSIGLLMTEKLQGDSTVWVRAASADIGNVLIAYMDYRPSDRTLVVGTHGRGVFITRIPDYSGIDGNDIARVTAFKLEQNYPNPFNPVTQINFEINSPGTAAMNIYNQKGGLVTCLADRYFYPGRYSLGWNAGGLPSGIYFCELKCGGSRAVKKMVLLK